MVTKFPIRALFPLRNRALPQLRPVTLEAYVSEPQASEQPLKQVKQVKTISSKFISVFKFCCNKVLNCYSLLKVIPRCFHQMNTKIS